MVLQQLLTRSGGGTIGLPSVDGESFLLYIAYKGSRKDRGFFIMNLFFTLYQTFFNHS